MTRPRSLLALIAVSAMVTGCGTTGPNGEHKSLIPLPWHHKATASRPDLHVPKLPAAGSGRGGYYQDDGPGANPPAGLMDVPDAIVRYEPYAKFANKPYAVFGTTYTPLISDEPFVQRGLASWYGVKFHGQRTSSGEPYDMYKMTAAHPTLPIPSYARITNLINGRSIVVRINDRGPFHSDRAIDVSYTAALKLGLLGSGSNKVEIERLFPGDEIRIASARRADASLAQTAPPAIAALMLDDRVAMDSAVVVKPQGPAIPPAREVAPTRVAQAVFRPVTPAPATVPAPAPASVPTAAAAAAPATVAGAGSAVPFAVAQVPTATQAQAPSATQAQALAAAPAPAPAQASGFYLQLGAFAREGKAEEMGEMLKKAGVSQTIEVVHAGAINRLYSGPYETRDLAQAAVRELPTSLGLKPIVVRR